MHRFFVNDDVIKDRVVKVTGSDFNHISHSLRLVSGDRFIVNNGDGLDYIVEINRFTEDTVIADIKHIQKNRNEPELSIAIAQAVPKKNNMDLVVQKCTEIGISKIIPINTERTIVKLDRKKFKKRRDRWQKIAAEAAKQSRRGIIPSVDNLYDLKKMGLVFEEYDLILIPWEDEKLRGLKSVWQKIDTEVNNILIIIGPEGGFSNDEVEFVKKQGGIAISLGPRILRTETAGFVALTAVLYEAGELGG